MVKKRKMDSRNIYDWIPDRSCAQLDWVSWMKGRRGVLNPSYTIKFFFSVFIETFNKQYSIYNISTCQKHPKVRN